MDHELQEIALAKKGLSNEEKMQFDVQYATLRKNPTTALILSLFLGGFGIDRFYTGYIGLGIGKLLTLGGLGFWAIIDWFLIMNAARRRNAESIRNIQTTIIQMR